LFFYIYIGLFESLNLIEEMRAYTRLFNRKLDIAVYAWSLLQYQVSVPVINYITIAVPLYHVYT
jgi:hypothetical protein